MKEIFKENKLTFLRMGLSVGLIVVAFIVGKYNTTASMVLYLLAYALSACLIILSAITQLIKEKTVGEKLLMTIASLGAIFVKQYFEATLIAILFELGEIIEDMAVSSSRKSINKLESIRPDKARLKGTNEICLAKDVKIGDIIEVLNGERIPLDGVIVDSAGLIDTSVITGESAPHDVRNGNEVLAGCLNVGGVIYIRVTRELSQSAMQRIIDLSQGALDKKTKNEKFIKRFASIYTPVIVILAVLIAVIPPLFDDYNFGTWVYRACSMLAISCPCALVISIPLAYFCGIGYASKKGILIKSSSVMESLDGINTIAFDKTGTLTKSALHVNKIESLEGVTKLELLKYVCIAELKSIHPISIAVAHEAKRFNIKVEEGTNYNEHAGMGIECDSPYGHIKAGSRLYVDAPSASSMGTVYVSLDGKYVGYIGIGDELKENSKIVFDHLLKMGVTKRIILSGDKQSRVDAVARTLCADGAYSNLLPENKLDAIEDIIETTENCKIAYCGDGINDLPSLARADVGIAMGAVGSDSAIDKSDVVIMDDDIGKIPTAIKISRRTKRVVIENTVFAISAKVVLLGLSVFGILPLFGAVLGDVGILILSVINSARSGR